MSKTSGVDDGTAGHNPAVPARNGQHDPNRLLLDIGQEIRSMRIELGEASTKFDVVVKDVSEVIGPDVADLRDQVATLRGQVDALLEEPEGEQEEERPLDWHELTSVEAMAAWNELRTWVDVQLGFNFEVRRGQLPDCWALHRPAVRQLWALHLLYGDAHDGPRASPLGMIEWNTRWIDAALGKIREAIPDSMCRPVAGRPGSHMVPKQEFERQRQARMTLHEKNQERLDRLGKELAEEEELPPYASAPGAKPAAAEPPSWMGTAAEQEIINEKFWGGFAAEAALADVRWRQEREALAATSGAAAGVPHP